MHAYVFFVESNHLLCISSYCVLYIVALFSYYFLHEEFGLRSFAGAALIILGIVVSNTSGSSKEDSNNSGVDQSI